MSMLSRITKQVYHEMKVIASDGSSHDIKILNSASSSSRSSKLDRQCIADTNSAIVPGMELSLYGNTPSIVSYKLPEHYRGRLIRYVIELIDATHTVNIYRTVVTKSTQGGMQSKADEPVYLAVPVKITLNAVSESKDIDFSLPKFVILLSTRYDIKVGDRMTLSDSKFEPAKINSLAHITPGLCEIRFDIDPRWL